MFGIFGAMRCSELLSITTNDVQDYISQFTVNIDNTKNDYPRSFVIGAEYYQIVKKYVQMRPSNMPSNRFFVQYQQGTCTRQFIGKNEISDVPKTVAAYLNLDNPSEYTGHCFRRSSATTLSNAGVNLSMVKQLGGWKSDAVVHGYIENSTANRNAIFNHIANSAVIHQNTNDSNSSKDASKSYDHATTSANLSELDQNKLNAKKIDKPEINKPNSFHQMHDYADDEPRLKIRKTEVNLDCNENKKNSGITIFNCEIHSLVINNCSDNNVN